MKKNKPKYNKITKLYIANRGEIALRIQRSAEKLGIPCCVGISSIDQKLSFARRVHEAVVIGPPPPHESYLSIEAVIAAAKASECNAVHPGYGFLSENHLFAERVIKEGLIWVGPSPESIRLMGSKVEGRAHAKIANVKTVPGTEGGLSDSQLIAAAKKIGYPLIIKAVGGGGGRGMRVIRTADELRELLPRARGEAQKNFGNDDIFLERFIEKPRHVEVQLLGDMYGTLLHLGTRDCSVQRRHQKLIEEAPAPFLTPTQRAAIHRAAISVARSVGYYSAGTAEFLVDGKNFYFLEMNTRIQVEHPVTESITGVDLVAAQLVVAQGEPLKLSQRKIGFQGHAIEYRINAEDARAHFMPTTGALDEMTLPEEEKGGIRLEFGFQAGDEVSVFYDGLIGKLIVSGATRREALQRSVAALAKLSIKGLITNTDFHRWIIRTRVFNQDGVDIAFVGREFDADCLMDLAAAEARDPQIGFKSDAPREEHFFSQHKSSPPVILRSRCDGIFVASVGSARKKKASRVASNSKKTALEALSATVKVRARS